MGSFRGYNSEIVGICRDNCRKMRRVKVGRKRMRCRYIWLSYSGNPETHRALMICSKSKLDSELEKLTKIFLENSYPEDVISVYIKEKIGNFSADIKFGPQKCPVYLKLPWIGNSSLRFESQIKQAITNCFFMVDPHVVYCTKKALPSIQMDCVPATQKSSVVYEFT